MGKTRTTFSSVWRSCVMLQIFFTDRHTESSSTLANQALDFPTRRRFLALVCSCGGKCNVQWPKAFWDPVAACGVCRLISNNIWDSLSPASVVKECKQLFINKCEVETTAPAKGSESIWKVWKKKMQRKNDEH